MEHPFVLLDRDGTIIEDRHYMHDPSDIVFLPHAIAGLRALQDHGYRFIIVTNQSGVARGYCTLAQAQQFSVAVEQRLLAAGVRIERTYLCPHHPAYGDPCHCRKPATGMVEQAASDFSFSPSQSIVVGDKDTDILLGQRCGGMTVRITNTQYPAACTADITINHLGDLAEYLLPAHLTA